MTDFAIDIGMVSARRRGFRQYLLHRTMKSSNNRDSNCAKRQRVSTFVQDFWPDGNDHQLPSGSSMTPIQAEVRGVQQ